MWTRQNRADIPQSRSGFTLAEMVIVVLIAGVATAIALPRWGTVLETYRVQNAASRIVCDLNRAQSAAYNRSTSITVTFSVSGSQYTVAGVTDMDHKSQSNYTVVLSAAPYQSQIQSAAFGSGATITYNGYGLPSAGGTVVVYAGSYSKTVSVDAATGKAVVQ